MGIVGELKRLVLHCTATREGLAISPSAIENYHKQVLKWDRVGYQKLFLLDGSVHTFVSPNSDKWVQSEEVTYGAGEYNATSFHWCYVGGLDKKNVPKDTRTDGQLQALEREVKAFIALHPNIKVIGHNQLHNKACPSFWVNDWLRKIGISDINIWDGGVQGSYYPSQYGKTKFKW